MNTLIDIIQRCHQRHKNPLQQKKTVITPSVYKGLFHHFTVYCAQRYPVTLYDLETAGISFMPLGGKPGHERVPQSFGGERFLSRQRMKDWNMRLWHTSWGIHVYTGVPSERDGARWHDLEFKYEAICAAPDAVFACIETLVNIVANPLLTMTATGGLRLSCRIPDYLHPNTETSRLYIHKDTLMPENLYRRDVYLEILGEAGYSSWDARCVILFGDLLNPPVIAKEILFTAIDALRAELHAPNPLGEERLKPTVPTVITSLPSLGSHKLDLAKEAFLKRGFSYIGRENDTHYWRQCDREGSDRDVMLWERDETAWIRASTSDLGLPTADTVITDVWDDTGILPPINTELRISDTVIAVQEGTLSPLAIKRPSPVLQKIEASEKVYEPLEKSIGQIKRVFETDKRVVGLLAETDARSNYEIESQLLKNGAVAFSAAYPIMEEAVEHFQRQNLPSLARWRHVTYLWGQVKEIPVEERMANPFERGNVCEDPERFLALVGKGVDARETLCPECPVYTECKERGYLSQPATLQRAKTQLFGFERTFVDPQQLAVSEKTLEPLNDTERLCIVSSVKTDGLFLDCSMSRKKLEEWCVNWQGHALGNFARALLNTLEIESEIGDFVVRRIRTVVRAFQQHEAEIVNQMCQVNLPGKIVKQGVIDEETGEELARFAIAFEGGASAYIPLDSKAADKLTALELPIFQCDSFLLDEDTSIPMSIQQAIELGILDMGTVEKIQEFPSVYPNPNWTFWHQLKRFLAHYPRDADAPMMWYDGILQFWVPPVLHPSIKRFVCMSATLSEQQFPKAFPREEIEFIHINSAPWVAGNQLFQIRSGVHTLRTLLDYDNTWDVIGLTKMGERFFLGICAEILRDPSVKHAIVTQEPIITQLKEVSEKENVCLVTEFRKLGNSETAFEAADIVWIVGAPHWEPGAIWHRAQVLYGSDEEPLSYEADTEFQHYKDERVQRTFIQAVAELITYIVGLAGLNRLSNKKVVLVSSLEIPDITDRPETLLFDWEDFEVAGGLDKLAETIAVRERFETEREQLTVESPREEVERILGCSARQANRVLQKFRGGAPRATFREQILSLLADGEKKAAEMTAAIDGHPQAIHKELQRLTKIGEIVKVRWGVYALPKVSPSKQ
ncbi:MAG: hypothetical protein OXC79_09915 [Candidatus Poribacteria bacterium]|nr:hypothetical protein [Candidatus Poribacteria bacterium]